VKFLRIVFMSLAALGLSACATSYQPLGLSGGFSETQLDKHVFRVSFNRNGYTSLSRAEDFTLLRSAELALKNGFSHFVIIDGRLGPDYATIIPPPQSTTADSASVHGNTTYRGPSAATTAGQTFIVQKPGTTNIIFCINGKPEGVFAYDASFIVRSLSEKYGLQLRNLSK
jgi:hypothetical protein